MTTEKPDEAPVTVSYMEDYKDARGEWRWRAKAANHEVISESGEGYVNRTHAHRVAHDLFPEARIVYL